MRHEAAKQRTNSTHSARGPATTTASKRQQVPLRFVAGVGVALLTVLALLAGPMLLWVYHIQRAGGLMDAGLVWPAARRADSLPTRADDAALDAALDRLARASYWRPDNPQAYQMRSEIYTARRDWPRAAEQLELARQHDPRNPLLAWQAGLVYEQMQRAIERAPHESLMEQFASARLVAPGQLITSLFCREGGAETCYFGQTEYALPYADSRDDTPVVAPVLFLHALARIEQTIFIPPDRTALEFMVGLDPAAREWKTDGATFRVSVQPPDSATPTLVHELALNRKAAQRGWARAWADLSPWAGQTVTLILASDPGPGSDPTDDWYGWADIALTSADAKRYALLRPRSRMLDAWDDAKLTAAILEARGDEARSANRPDEAQAWYQRATAKRGKLDRK